MQLLLQRTGTGATKEMQTSGVLLSCVHTCRHPGRLLTYRWVEWESMRG